GLGSAERLMTIGWTDGDVSGGVPLELIERIAAETTTLDFAAGALSYALPGETETTFVSVELVTRELFPNTRPRIVLGRGFEAADHSGSGDNVGVISYDHWQEQFDGRDDVVGQAVLIRGQPVYRPRADGQMEQVPAEPVAFRVIGVAAPE